MHTARLDCEHTLQWRTLTQMPTVHARIWCPRCTEYRIVVSRHTDWRIRCVGCRLSRSYGAAKLTAEMRASHHARRFAGHKVFIYQEGLEDQAVSVVYDEAKLFDDERIPF